LRVSALYDIHGNLPLIEEWPTLRRDKATQLLERSAV
jgi:hypothetical protein